MNISENMAAAVAYRARQNHQGIDAIISSLSHARDLVLITEDEYNAAVKWLYNQVDH